MISYDSNRFLTDFYIPEDERRAEESLTEFEESGDFTKNKTGGKIMSIESAKLFIERLQTDNEFAGKITDCKDYDTLMIFEIESGFDFNDKELKKAYAELNIDDHNKMTGGVSPYPTVQILQAAMAHRESIRSNFESQREALRKAIEAQRRAASGK